MINRQCTWVRAFRIWHINMQIIVVGVTNRQVHQKYDLLAFVVPLGQP